MYCKTVTRQLHVYDEDDKWTTGTRDLKFYKKRDNTDIHTIWITVLYMLTVSNMTTVLNVDFLCDIKRIKYIQKWIIKFGDY
jgi:hypothetical protein